MKVSHLGQLMMSLAGPSLKCCVVVLFCLNHQLQIMTWRLINYFIINYESSALAWACFSN